MISYRQNIYETQVQPDESFSHIVILLYSLIPLVYFQYFDYMMKVMLPEIFIKIYMEIYKLSHEEAEDKLADFNFSQNSDDFKM